MSRPESATLKAGDQAPLFTLPNQKGVPVSLEAALARQDPTMPSSESRSLGTGDHAPLFTLPNQKGVPVSLEAAIEKGPVLLGFHRGTW